MNIKKYQPNSSSVHNLVNLLQVKYGTNKNMDYFLSDFNKAFSFCLNNENIQFQPIAVFEKDHLCAHIALIIDKRLPKGEAFFGFMETPKNVFIFNSMWNSLVTEAQERGISILKGQTAVR